MQNLSKADGLRATAETTNHAAHAFRNLVAAFGTLLDTHDLTTAHQAIHDQIDNLPIDPIQWMLTVAAGREALRQRPGTTTVCNRALGVERYCGLYYGHRGECDPQPKTAAHEHGYTTRDGLGFLPLDAGCTGCCEVATDAYRATLGDVGKCPQCGRQARSYSQGCSWCIHRFPATDTQANTAALDDKAAEAAGEVSDVATA